MNEKNLVKVDITADIEPYKRANAQVLQEQRTFQQEFERNEQAHQQRQAQREKEMQARVEEANRRWQAFLDRQKQAGTTQAEANGEAEKYVKRLQEQAATLGLTGTALERYRASQMNLTAEQKKAVAASLAQIEAHERHQATLTRLTSIARVASAALGAAAVAGLAMSVRAAEEAERSERRFAALHRATGGTAGLSLGQLGDLQGDLLSSTRFGSTEIRDAMSVLMTYRQVSGDTFREVMQIAAGMADVMGGSLTSAVKRLGTALDDPLRGMSNLTEAGVTFTAAQRDAVREMMETGRTAEAMQVILEQLRSKGFDEVAEAINQDYTKAWSNLRNEVELTLEALGKSSTVKVPVIGMIDGVARAVRNLRDIAEGGDWYTRILSVFMVLSPGAVLLGRTPNAPPAAADPNSPEARNARIAAENAQWQRDFDAQNERLKKIIADADKKFGKDRDRHLMLGERWTGQDLNRAQADAARELEVLGAQIKRREEGTANFTKAQIEAYVEAAQAITELGDSVVYTWDEFGNQVVMTKEKFAELERGANITFRTVRDKGSEAFRELQFAVEGWGRDTSRALASMAVQGRFSFESLTDAARRFGEELLAIQIQRRVMGPLLQAGTEFLDGVLNPPPTVPADSSLFGEFHGGGVVGVNGRGRYASPALLARAPRMHTGGINGLRPNERPAVLEVGEEVLTRRDPRHRWNGGGVPRVTVNVINQSGAPVSATASEPTFDAEGMVVEVVLRDLSGGGPIRDRVQALQREVA